MLVIGLSIALLAFTHFQSTLPATGASAESVAPMVEEITLFDSDGAPVAYIAPDEELTIYLWDGQPVAYLVPDDGAFSIYGFNGSHLGWLEKGIVRDHDGHAVGFVKGAVNRFTQLEPFKSFKQFKPFKAFKEFEPPKPRYSMQFSATPLSLFLAAGAN